MSGAEKCPLEQLLQALSQMDQAAIEQEKLNAKLQAENDLQACELGRLQSELSTRLARVAPSTAASPAGPAVPRWLWAMSFCLLLMGLYQASAFGQLQRHLQLRSEAPATPSLKSASESKVSHMASDQVHHLRVQSMWEGNGSSGDELTMITPAPSKSLKLGSTTDSKANSGYVSDTQQPETVAQGDKAEEIREADATPPPQEERQPDLMSEEQVEPRASATEEPETAAQGDKAEETREADATPPLEERQPDLMSEEQVEPRESATEEPETAAQVDKAQETREADATPPLEERQPDVMSEEQVEPRASATEEPETATQVDKAEETREADATPPQKERQPDLMSEEQVEPRASATEEPETAAQVDKAEETREADASWHRSATTKDAVFLDEFLSLCDTHLMGSSWKKAAHCNATPWPCGLAFLGGSRTLVPDCNGEEPSLPSWSLPSMQVFSEKLWEKEELIEHSLGAAIGLLAGAWCFW